MVDWGHVLEVLANLFGGGLLLAAGRWLGKRLDLPIITLQLENERLREDLKKLGEKYDNLEARALAVTVRIMENPNVDDALAEDMPTGVHSTAGLIAKKPPSVPPETKDALRKYVEDD